MTLPGAITVRPGRSDDERELVTLFGRVFGRPITQQHWQWKLRQQSSPADNVWLAVSGEQPVFQYAGIPTRFLLLQTPVLAMTSVDTMTAPEFRRQGLLTQVASRAYDAWRSAGVAFVIGLPNQQWGSRAAALGWQPLFPLQWLLRPLRPEAMLARRLNFAWLKRARFVAAMCNRALNLRLRRDPTVQTQRTRQADDAFDQIWERCKSGWMFSTIRDRHWVDWRFLSPPSQRYELNLARRAGVAVGYSAHTLVQSRQAMTAHLAELFVARTDAAAHDTLLSELIASSVAAGAESLSTLAVPGSSQYRWLRRAGFIPRQAFSVQLVPLDAQLPHSLMLDPDQWNLSGADFDVI
jgi:Acetyltransferase (GNAT) domain